MPSVDDLVTDSGNSSRSNIYLTSVLSSFIRSNPLESVERTEFGSASVTATTYRDPSTPSGESFPSVAAAFAAGDDFSIPHGCAL